MSSPWDICQRYSKSELSYSDFLEELYFASLAEDAALFDKMLMDARFYGVITRGDYDGFYEYKEQEDGSVVVGGVGDAESDAEGFVEGSGVLGSGVEFDALEGDLAEWVEAGASGDLVEGGLDELGVDTGVVSWRVVASHGEDGRLLRGDEAKERPAVLEFVFGEDVGEDGGLVYRSVLLSERVVGDLLGGLGKVRDSYEDVESLGDRVRRVRGSVWRRMVAWHRRHKFLGAVNLLVVGGVSLTFVVLVLRGLFLLAFAS